MHPEPRPNTVQRKRPPRMQRRQRQHDVPHHQLHRHPKKQPAHHPMLRHEPQPPANPIKNPRRRTGNEVVQHEPQQINTGPATRNHSRPQQSGRDHFWNIPPKQNTSLQNIQRPSHEPRNPDRHHCISLSTHLIRRIHPFRPPSRSPPCSRDRFPDRGPLRSPAPNSHTLLKARG
jgi:hypothetical protein